MGKLLESFLSIITSTLPDLVMKSSPDIPTTIVSKGITNVVGSPLKMLSDEVKGYLDDKAKEKKLFDAVEKFHKDFYSKKNDGSQEFVVAFDKVAVEKRSDLIAIALLCISSNATSSSPKLDYIPRASAILQRAGCEVDATEYLGGVYYAVLNVFLSSAPDTVKAGFAAMMDVLYSKLKEITQKIKEFEDARSDQPPQFTDKNKIAPFTKSRADSAQGGTYVPRNDLLKKIKASFSEQTGGKRVVLLTGMGGCGKSELARAYAEEHRDEYDEIFWLTYGTEKKTSPKLMELFDACSNKVDNVEQKDVLSFTSNTLVIVDNCDRDDSTFLHELENSTGEADILITTRRYILGSFEIIVPVESVDPTDFSYSVFENNYCKKPQHGCAKQIKDDEPSSVRQICDLVQNNTMVVAMIAIRLREYNSLTISECAEKMANGIRNIKGKIKVTKDQDHHTGEILDILEFLFEDILSFDFNTIQRRILTVLALTPAEWYEIDYISSLTGGVAADDYRFEASELLTFGFLQGTAEQIAIHSIVAELILGKPDITIRESSFYEEILANYLGLKEEYLLSQEYLIGKILRKATTAPASVTLPTMLMLKRSVFNTFFSKAYPYVNVACFVRVDLKDKRVFQFRDLEKEQTTTLKEVPLSEPGGEKDVLLEVFSNGAGYTLDLSQSFYNLTITEIPARICQYDYRIKKLSLPNKCVAIGDGAFSICSGLTGELHLPDGLTSIGGWAFYRCSGLTGELHLPDGLASIGGWAFYCCSGLTGELHLPDDLTSIGEFAFFDCSGLTGELHLPDGLASIGKGAFFGCLGITKLFVHNSNTDLGKDILGLNHSVVVCGYKGSTAEKYAKEYNLLFEELT